MDCSTSQVKYKPYVQNTKLSLRNKKEVRIAQPLFIKRITKTITRLLVIH